MRGVFAMIIFLLLATALVAMIAAASDEERLFSKTIENSFRKKELFYAARDSESSFWQSMKKAQQQWSTDCLLLSKCSEEDFNTKVGGWSTNWQAYLKNLPVDFEANVPEDSLSLIRTDVIPNPTGDFPVGEFLRDNVNLDNIIDTTLPVMVYVPKVAITAKEGQDSILVKISDGDYETYGMLSSGESSSCFIIVANDKYVAGKMVNLAQYLLMPLVSQELGIPYCLNG